MLLCVLCVLSDVLHIRRAIKLKSALCTRAREKTWKAKDSSDDEPYVHDHSMIYVSACV